MGNTLMMITTFPKALTYMVKHTNMRTHSQNTCHIIHESNLYYEEAFALYFDKLQILFLKMNMLLLYYVFCTNKLPTLSMQ